MKNLDNNLPEHSCEEGKWDPLFQGNLVEYYDLGRLLRGMIYIVAKKTLQNRFQIDWSYIWSIEVIDTIWYYEMIDID